MIIRRASDIHDYLPFAGAQIGGVTTYTITGTASSAEQAY